jgi:hypothetical protein
MEECGKWLGVTRLNKDEETLKQPYKKCKIAQKILTGIKG